MGNAPASIGPAINVDTITRALLNGDGTFSVTGLPYRGDGIVVAIPAHSAAFVTLDDSSDTDHLFPFVAAWVAKNASAITDNPAPFFRPRFFGSWFDSETGTLWLDIVEAFPREKLSEAIAAGIDRDQIAIWDNGRGEVIVPGAVD